MKVDNILIPWEEDIQAEMEFLDGLSEIYRSLATEAPVHALWVAARRLLLSTASVMDPTVSALMFELHRDWLFPLFSRSSPRKAWTCGRRQRVDGSILRAPSI